MAGRVVPQVLRGMRDILPSRMIVRQYVIRALQETFERFGFEPLETPAIEYAETLEGKSGEEADRLIYRFEDRGGRHVGLRYDLTVPLARVVAMYPDLVKPFKRYQIAPVWRAERPQRGRYREFYQCDADIVGSASAIADAEVVSLADAALIKLGFSRFRTKINNRKILLGLGDYAGVDSSHLGSIYRAMDKLEKIGRGAVHEEMVRYGIESAAAERLLELVDLRGEACQVLKEVRSRLSGTALGEGGVEELERVVGHLDELGVPESRYEIDLAMVRGLGYYTGPIFETVVDEPKIGSICGGGRYDELVAVYGTQSYPAVGISVGLERIVDVLEELNLAPSDLGKTTTEVLVTVFGPDEVGHSLQLVGELRSAGINSEVFLGTDRLPSQLRYASRKGIPYVILAGPDELAKGSVLVKDMTTGEQKGYDRDGVVMALSRAREARKV